MYIYVSVAFQVLLSVDKDNRVQFLSEGILVWVAKQTGAYCYSPLV